MSQSVEREVLDFGFKAGADMSPTASGPNIDGSFRFCAVKLDTATAWQVQLAGAAPASVIGILQNEPVSGSAASVRLIGISQMIVDGGAGAIAPGDRLKSDASSRGVKTTADRDRYIAIALEASSATNDRIAVLATGPDDVSQ